MDIQTLAHLSDLHMGRSDEQLRAAMTLRDALLALDVSHVVVTGDLTHRGRVAEWSRFEEVFAPLMPRVTLVPGNHDRLGDEVARRMMPGERVEVVKRDGLHLVRVDSTGPHNRFLLAGHGALCERVLDQVDAALEDVACDALTVVMLHHHPLPLPEETLSEHLAASVGLPFAAELRLGHAMLQRISGRCDLVLHGHRHVPRAHTLRMSRTRPLGLYNAGCSTEIGRFRMFRHAQGALLGPPLWLDAEEVTAGLSSFQVEVAS
jgi:3',5'-cyclic AMP phosphodiesterase CpdA